MNLKALIHVVPSERKKDKLNTQAVETGISRSPFEEGNLVKRNSGYGDTFYVRHCNDICTFTFVVFEFRGDKH